MLLSIASNRPGGHSWHCNRTSRTNLHYDSLYCEFLIYKGPSSWEKAKTSPYWFEWRPSLHLASSFLYKSLYLLSCKQPCLNKAYKYVCSCSTDECLKFVLSSREQNFVTLGSFLIVPSSIITLFFQMLYEPVRDKRCVEKWERNTRKCLCFAEVEKTRSCVNLLCLCVTYTLRELKLRSSW